MSKTNTKSRPLFPNHIEKVDTIRARQKERGAREYSGDVLRHANDLGIKYPIVTCKQRDNKYTKPNMYGVELEISTDMNTEQLYDAAEYPFFIIKNDSSVSRCRTHALEVVGVPASLKANCVLWSRWADKVIQSCESDLEQIGNQSSGCNGLHVHVDKENFIDTRHMRNFLAFFNYQWHHWFIYTVSDRKDWYALDRWAKPLYLRKGKSLKEWVKTIEHGCRSQDKYAFTNMRHSNTIEVRVFQGDLSAASIVKNLQFVDSVVEFTKERSASTCDLKFYMKWLEATDKSRYSELKEFLKQVDLEPVWAEYNFWKTLQEFSKKDAPKKYVGKKLEVTFKNSSNIWERVNNAEFNLMCKPVWSDDGNFVTITAEFKEPKRTKLFNHHKTTVSRYSRISNFVAEAA